MIKVILTDALGVLLLILVPFFGPLPGPGGIPLLLAGLGLLSVNHERPRKWLHYVRQHSESLRNIFFPDKTIVKWAWDIAALLIFCVGLGLNLNTEGWLLQGFSIVVMAGSTTIFIFNRNRIEWVDNQFKRFRKQ